MPEYRPDALRADLAHAKVFVSVLGEGKPPDESLEVLSRAAKFFRTRLSQTLNLRRTPEIRFVLDTTEARGARIDRLLDKHES